MWLIFTHLEVVDRGSEVQLQVGDFFLIWWTNVEMQTRSIVFHKYGNMNEIMWLSVVNVFTTTRDYSSFIITGLLFTPLSIIIIIYLLTNVPVLLVDSTNI